MSPNVHLSPFALSDRLHRADSDAFTTELVASATLFCHGGQAGLYAVPSAVFPTWGLHDMPNQYVTYQMASESPSYDGQAQQTRPSNHASDARTYPHKIPTDGSDGNSLQWFLPSLFGAPPISHGDGSCQTEALRKSGTSHITTSLIETHQHQILEHEESSTTNTMGAQRVDTSPASSPIPITRTRSLAIPIEDRSEEDDYSEEESTELYDSATWRLYHRIVEHRQTHPLTSSYFDRVKATTESTGESCLDQSLAASLGVLPQHAWNSALAASAARHSEPLEGEIFDLEL